MHKIVAKFRQIGEKLINWASKWRETQVIGVALFARLAIGKRNWGQANRHLLGDRKLNSSLPVSPRRRQENILKQGNSPRPLNDHR